PAVKRANNRAAHSVYSPPPCAAAIAYGLSSRPSEPGSTGLERAGTQQSTAGVSARTTLVTGIRLSLAGRSPARSAGMTGTNVAALPVCIPYLSVEYRLDFSVRTPAIIPRSPHERSDMRELRTARREPGLAWRRRSLACTILRLLGPCVE